LNVATILMVKQKFSLRSQSICILDDGGHNSAYIQLLSICRRKIRVRSTTRAHLALARRCKRVCAAAEDHRSSLLLCCDVTVSMAATATATVPVMTSTRGHHRSYLTDCDTCGLGPNLSLRIREHDQRSLQQRQAVSESYSKKYAA